LLELIDVARHVHVASSVRAYVVEVVDGTRRHGEVMLGASPRSSLYLLRASRAKAASEGREYVTPDDIKALAAPVLEHRLAFRPEAQMRGVRAADVIDAVLSGLRVPISRSDR
jgi:MoxR-like ATPase